MTTQIPQGLDEALGLFLVALVVAITNWMNNRSQNKRIKEVSKRVDSTKVSVESVETTLNTNNGGSTVKDKLDKILRWQDEADGKFYRIENNQQYQDSKIEELDSKINRHIYEGFGRIIKKKRNKR